MVLSKAYFKPLESGIRNQESGIRNQESGIRNQESGIRNQRLKIASCFLILIAKRSCLLILLDDTGII